MSRVIYKVFFSQCLLLFLLPTLKSQSIEGPESGTLSPGTVGFDQTTCIGGDPDLLTNEVSGTGVNATYQWVTRVVGGSWTDIAGANSSEYDPPAGITEKTFYRRRIDQSGATSLFSNTIEINVGPTASAGTIAGPTGTFCASYSGRLTSTTGGNGLSIEYQWQWRSTSSASAWEDILSDDNLAYYDVVNLTEEKEFRRLTKTCGLELSSNVLTVTVTGTTLDVGEIALDGSNVNCYNANAPDFISLEDPSGGDGSFDYLWQYKNADTNDLWDDAPGDNDDLSYSPGVLDKTTSYRRQVSSCTFTSETPAIVISVIPFLTAGAIDPNKDDQWVCHGGDATNLTLSAYPSGGDPGNYEYQWQQRTPGGSWTDATGTGNQNDNYTPMNLTSTQEFRVKVTSPGCSQEDDTDAITVNVHPELQKGSISVGSTDVCYGSAFTINSDVDATGGVNNSPTYHWQERTDPEDDGTYGAWQDIAGENAATLTITSASVDAEYRRAAQSCGPREYSDIITIDVSSSTMSPGSISSSRVVCYDTPPGEITGAQPPSGGNGTFDYLWQYKSEDTNDLWEDAPGVNDELTYTPGSLIKTTSYRRRVKSCNITEFTAAVTMTVTPSLTAGAIDPNKDDQWVCHGGDATNLTLSVYPSGGDPGNYTYQWQQRTPGGSWTDATGTGNQNDNYTPMNLTSTQEFRVKVTSPGCSEEDDTDAITVNVHPELQKGSISVGSTDVCYGSAFTINSDVDATGGVNNSPTYHWQERTDPEDDGTYGAWQDIAGENAATLTITSASVDAEYRRAAQSCGPREYSDIITIDVSSSTMSPGSISSSRVVCYDTPPGEITGAQPPSGGNGTFDYLWQHKSEDTNDLWEDAPGVNDELTYTPGSLIKTTSYRRRVESCNITEFTAAVTMTVTPSLTAGAIDPNKDGQWVCYGGDATNLTMSTGPSGGDPGNYTYQWQQRTPGGSWTDATGTGNQNDNYTPMNLTSTQEFRVKVTSPGCSEEDDTDAITVNVHPDVVPGEINGPSTLCYGELAVFTSEIAGSGGVPGGLSYKWQQRTGPAFDGSYGPWEDIDSGESDNANGILSTYNTTLTESMEFRRSIYACGPREYSNVIAVSVDLPLLPAITDLEVCSGAPVTLTPVGSLPSGATYHWYEEDGGPVVHTGDTYPTSFTQDAILYVIAVSSGGCEGPQKTIQVEVNPSPEAPGVIGASLCETGSVELAVNAQAGYTYQWYDMSDQYLASGTTYSTPQISTTTQYKVRATNNLGCTSEESIVTAAINTVSVPVDPEIVQSCNHLYLSVTESTDTDVTYYWQGQNSTGKSTSQPASGYYRVEQSGTYYIRAYNDATNCWSLATDIVVDTELLAPPSRIVPIDCDGAMAGNIYTPPAAYDNSETYSYTRVYTAIEEGLTYETITDPAQPKEDVSIVTSFVDGLGRPLQTVSKEASPQGFDMVQPVYYDQFGRSSRQYMSYSASDASGEIKTDPFNDQSTMLNSHFEGEDVFYGLTQYDDSPLNRVTKAMAPGNSWAGNFVGVETTYATNSLEDGVRAWRVIMPDSEGEYINPATNETIAVEAPVPEDYEMPITNYVYPAGSLYMNIIKDEDGNIVKEYTDKTGLLILKKQQVDDVVGDGHTGWASTYYVYDNMDRLMYIFPPKAVEMLESNSFSYDKSTMDAVVFQYTYDGRGRQVSKQIPASGREEMVYDRLDRLVASQNAYQASLNAPYWVFTKFDHHDRVVAKGAYFGSETRSQLQNSLQNFSINVTASIPATPGVTEGVNLLVGKHEAGVIGYKARQRIELLPGFSTEGSSSVEVSLDQNLSIDNKDGYNDGTFPTDGVNVELYEVIFYDDHRFTNKGFDSSFPEFSSAIHGVLPVEYADYRGLSTGSRIRVLGSDQWLEQVYFYDDRGRIIQKRFDNKNGGEKTETRQFSFAGNLLSSHLRHTNPFSFDSEITVLKQYEFDHLSRKKSYSQVINGFESPKTLARYTYNPLGQLHERILGNHLESLEYTYNIRGWLQGINNDELQTEGNLKDHLFAYGISYDHGFSKSRLTQNISGVRWKTSSNPTPRSFGYDYDRLSRLTRADYAEGENWDILIADFSLDNLNYDINGNILSLSRNGFRLGQKEDIDELIFTYDTSSPNRLLSVSDLSDSDLGYKNTNGQQQDYNYDSHGNLVSDSDKDIETVTYNYLNLPENITLEDLGGDPRESSSIYNAQGTKLSEIYNDGAQRTQIDYLDGFIYENDTLKMFSHDEGRVRNTRFGLVYDYQVKDHLGNTRLTLTEQSNEVVYLATMETDINEESGVDLQAYEDNLFLNMNATRQTYLNANYTVSLSYEPDKSARLNGADTDKRVGPGKLLAVFPGDVIDMEVFAYYEGSLGTGVGSLDATTIASALGNAFGGVAGGAIEQQIIYDGFNANPLGVAVGEIGINQNQPRAYLNYVLLNKDFDFEDAGFVQVPEDAMGSHEKLGIRRAVTKPGFIYVYVSNETDADFNVYFDDLRIEHSKGRVIQESHYYPFGLSIDALSYSDNSLSGVPSGDKFNLGWNNLGFRNFNPAIARFFNTDPMSELEAEQSTYHYSGNNPVNKVDLLGLTQANPWGRTSQYGGQSLLAGLRDILLNTEYLIPTRRKKERALIPGPFVYYIAGTGGLDDATNRNTLRNKVIGTLIDELFEDLSEVNPLVNDIIPEISTRNLVSNSELVVASTPEINLSVSRNKKLRINYIPPSMRLIKQELDATRNSNQPLKLADMEKAEIERRRRASQAMITVAQAQQYIQLQKMAESMLDPVNQGDGFGTPDVRSDDVSHDFDDDEAFEEYLANLSLDEVFYPPEATDSPQEFWENESGYDPNWILQKLMDYGYPPWQAGFIQGLLDTVEGAWKIFEFAAAMYPFAYSACGYAWYPISCEQVEEIRLNTYRIVQFLNDMLHSEEKRAAFTEGVKDSLEEYWDGLSCFTQECLFNQGKLMFDIFAAFFGVTEIRALLAGGTTVTQIVIKTITSIPRNLAKTMKSLLDDGGFKLVSETVEGVVDAITHLTDDAGKVLAKFTKKKNTPETSMEYDYDVEITDPEILDKISPSQRNDLNRDVSENNELVTELIRDKELVDAWKKVDDLGDNAFDQLRKDPDFLKKFDDVVKNDGLNKHVLEGDVEIIGTNAAGENIYKVTGIHSNKAFADGTTRIKPGTQVDDLGDGFYKAKVEKQIDGFVNAEGTNWKVKTNKSTFFPDSWSTEKIQAEIANAFKNKTSLGGNKYQGTTTTGHTVVMFLDEAGKIKTAFPSF